MKRYRLPLFLALVSTLHADQFAFQWYNDLFAGTDRHFTNGGSISWMDNTFGEKGENETNRYSALMFNIANSLPLTTMETARRHNAGISLYQMIITPTDITQSEPQYDDVPYTGYLALSFYLFEWDDDAFDEYRTDFGVVGPESGAGWLQTSIHRLTNSTEPQGWDTQLGTQWTVNLLLRHGMKSWQHQYAYGLQTDWFNHFGVQAGNFIVDGFGGTIWRFGQNYINNFNVVYPNFKEEAALLKVQEHHHGVGWSVSIGATAELLAYAYILNEAEKLGYQLEQNFLTFSTYLDASLYLEGQKITFFYQSQSPYIRDQRQIDAFGGFKLALQF